MGPLVLFVAYSVILVLAGYNWRKWEGELSTHDRPATRVSMLGKL